MTLRDATPDDYDAFAQLFPELKVDDPTPSRETYLATIMPTTRVATDETGVIAYLWASYLVPETYVRHVVVSERARGQRVGERMMREVAERARLAGASRWSLNVKPNNTSALNLYRRLGFEERHRSMSLRFDWSLTEALPTGAPPAFRIEADHDTQLEADLHLTPGLLKELRGQPNRFLYAVSNQGRMVGVAAFNAGFPGAFPFKAESPAVARSLLEAVRPHALPQYGYMQTVVEGQPSLAETLRSLGAMLRLEIANLVGPLP